MVPVGETQRRAKFARNKQGLQDSYNKRRFEGEILAALKKPAVDKGMPQVAECVTKMTGAILKEMAEKKHERDCAVLRELIKLHMEIGEEEEAITKRKN